MVLLSNYKNGILTTIHKLIILEMNSGFIKPILSVVIFHI